MSSCGSVDICYISALVMVILDDLGSVIILFLTLEFLKIEQNVKLSLIFFVKFLSTCKKKMLWVSLGLRIQRFKNHLGSEETRHEAGSCSMVVGWRLLQSPSSVFLISASQTVQPKRAGCRGELILSKGKR